MKIDMRAIGGDTVLAGAINGKQLFAKLLSATTREPPNPERVFLDFSGVDVATASLLRESVLNFRDFVRRQRSNFYPVVANANDAIKDELRELVGPPRNDVVIVCLLDESGVVSDVNLIGNLEPTQKRTFDIVCGLGETDAGELMRAHGKEERITRPTAWNNRLTSLTLLGLLMEISRGRAKRYKPLFEGG
jgi:hypothetical protein